MGRLTLLAWFVSSLMNVPQTSGHPARHPAAKTGREGQRDFRGRGCDSAASAFTHRHLIPIVAYAFNHDFALVERKVSI